MKFQQLTSEQRYTISVLLQKEMSKKAIAEAIGVYRSTVYREIERNSSEYTGKYTYTVGQESKKEQATLSETSQDDSWDVAEYQ